MFQAGQNCYKTPQASPLHPQVIKSMVSNSSLAAHSVMLIASLNIQFQMKITTLLSRQTFTFGAAIVFDVTGPNKMFIKF